MSSLDDKTILGWDVYNWSAALRFWETLLESKKNLVCLELGSNKGGLSLWLASKGHKVVCSDVMDASEEKKKDHSKYSFSSNISYEKIDVTNIPYENYYDVVILKSVLGAVGREDNTQIDKAVKQIHKCLKPGGLFLFAENIRATKMHGFLRRHFGAKTWYFPHHKEIKDVLNVFGEVKIHTYGFLGAMGYNEKTKKILGTIDNLILKNLPSGWHYIAYGYAKK